MTAGEFDPEGPEALRKDAESRLKKEITPGQFPPQTPEEIRELVHELQVHQVELEMQQEELRRSQQELAQSEEKYRQLYQFAPAGYFTLNANGAIEEANIAAAQLLGMERHRLGHQLLRRFIHPASRADFDRFFMNLIRENAPQTCEAALLNLQDTPRIVLLNGVILEKDFPVDCHYLVTAMDITERKGAESEILKQNHILKQAETLAGMGSWEYDRLSGAFTWSKGMYHLFGTGQGTKILPTVYLEHAVDKDWPVAEKLTLYLQRGTGTFEETIRIKSKSQTISLKIRALVLPDDQGQFTKVLGVDLDITELTRLEKENLQLRLKSQQQLLHGILQAQEEERRRISESLHNGVGQLLYATKLNLERIDLNSLAGSENHSAIDNLVKAKRQAEQLLSEAITETRRVSHELIPLLLEEYGLEAAMRDFCQRFAHTGLQLSCHTSSVQLEKHLEMAIYRMAQELVNNIVKHSGATRARIEVFAEKDWVIMEAQDNGKGLDTGTNASKGIGLKTIQDRVKLLDGTLQIDSVNGKGTLITISLPLMRTE